MGVKKVFGRIPETREKIEGYGVKFIDEQIFVVTKDGDIEIIPSSLRIRHFDDHETFSKEVMTQKQVHELHNLMVETIIKYLKSQNITEVDEVTFGVDGLMPSVEFGYWTPGTDSSLHLYGYEDEKNKTIGYSI